MPKGIYNRKPLSVQHRTRISQALAGRRRPADVVARIAATKSGRASNGHVYKRLEREGFPRDGYRLLCMNCNFAHGRYGYCPHERTRRKVS